MKKKLFNWFFWLYNVGVVLTSAMLSVHGSMTVAGVESNKMISGIAGLGHIILTAGLTVFFVVLGKAVNRQVAAKSDVEAA
ncbi:DUF2871 family protein [Actinomyces minihominis]|uniref:DUF2871 family protein n=1 Tax=Actinomyces minihominis TaxID=2002838 RepID=UPI000C0881F1|nr:DUF2871 family protein [Actinomyces minihominis]